MNYLGLPVSPRVNQLDASLLDSELLSQFKEQLKAAFKYWRPEIKDKYEPELMLALRALLFKVTVWDYSTTYGAKLQNLLLVSAKTKQPIGFKTKVLYGIIVILSPYIWQRLQDKELIDASLMDKFQLVYNGASLLNFVSFLFSGKYLTILMRLFGARFASVSKKAVRNVNYEFQNRQLIWNALTEFLLFLLPMINFRKLFRTVVRPWTQAKKTGSLSFLSKRICAICFEQDSTVAVKGITNPFVAGCEHPYCYVCLSLRLAEDPKWNCLKCNKTLNVSKMKPYGCT